MEIVPAVAATAVSNDSKHELIRRSPDCLTPALRDDDRCLSVRVRYANILATGISTPGIALIVNASERPARTTNV